MVDRQTDRYKGRQKDGQTGRKSEKDIKKKGRQTERKTNRKARQTLILTWRKLFRI